MFGKTDCESSETGSRCGDDRGTGMRRGVFEEDFQGFGQRGRRPGVSYADLITEAIENSPEGMLTLKEIYSYISAKHPYFSLKKSGWQNSIRHNLSLNKSFYKVPRTSVNPGKGSFWKINYEFQSNKPSQKNCRPRGKYSFTSYRHAQDVSSLSEILGQQSFLDGIGVTEMPFKQHVTTVFDGNLTTLTDCLEQSYPREFFDYPDDAPNTNHIFSFK